MAGHGGGAWKVAYADFVTAMMAFFMVMWITAQSKPVKQAIAKYFNDPLMSSTKPSGSGAPSAPDEKGESSKPSAGPQPIPLPGYADPGRRAAPSARPKAGGSQKQTIAVLHDGSRRVAGAVVLFDENSAELTADGKKSLQDLVPLLLGKPNKVEVRGHATRRPLPPDSPYQDAWQLSFARCVSTMNYLAKHGVEPERLRLSQGGPFEPLTIRLDADNQLQNSRVELYVLSELVDEFMGTRDERNERIRSSGLSKGKAP
jgi:chemotaxis protein MotB